MYDMDHPDDLLRAIDNGGVNKAVEELQEHSQIQRGSAKREHLILILKSLWRIISNSSDVIFICV